MCLTRNLYCLCVISLCLLCSLCGLTNIALAQSDEKPNTLTEYEQQAGFELLFDGKTLSPEIWQNGIEGYPVEDGKFVCRQGGKLETKKKYKDFIFRFEFKLTQGGNNGVGVRYTGGGDPAYSGMEIQILDHLDTKRYSDLNTYQRHGAIYGVVAPKQNPEKRDYLKPNGEWNVEEITAIGSYIKVVLNGETILEADISQFQGKETPDHKAHPGLNNAEGFISFLGHGDPIEFRSVRVKELK